MVARWQWRCLVVVAAGMGAGCFSVDDEPGKLPDPSAGAVPEARLEPGSEDRVPPLAVATRTADGTAGTVELAVVWYPVQSRTTFGDVAGHLIASSVARASSFDAMAFTVELTTPPPLAARNEWLVDDGLPPPEPVFAETYLGTIAMLVPGRVPTLPAEVAPSDIRGLALDTGVVYFERDGVPGDERDEINGNAEWLGVEPTQGFHLYAIVASPEARAAFRQCQWNGVCVHHVGIGQSGFFASTDWEAITDAEYQQCVRETLDPQTCTYYSVDALTPEQAVENTRCLGFQRARLGVNCESPVDYPGNPGGFARPVRITLGANALQWYLGY